MTVAGKNANSLGSGKVAEQTPKSKSVRVCERAYIRERLVKTLPPPATCHPSQSIPAEQCPNIGTLNSANIGGLNPQVIAELEASAEICGSSPDGSKSHDVTLIATAGTAEDCDTVSPIPASGSDGTGLGNTVLPNSHGDREIDTGCIMQPVPNAAKVESHDVTPLAVDPRRFHVLLVDIGTPNDPPTAIRLRLALKAMLRRLSFRCDDIRPARMPATSHNAAPCELEGVAGNVAKDGPGRLGKVGRVLPPRGSQIAGKKLSAFNHKSSQNPN